MTLSVDGDIPAGTAGHYYVNMPWEGTDRLTLTASDIVDGKGTFKVYDDGGASGDYSNGCEGYLVITAPTGYKINLAGSGIQIEDNCDWLKVYNDADPDNLGTPLTEICGENQSVDVSSKTGSMVIYFTSDGGGNFAGFELTVTLEEFPDLNITVNSASGGSIAATTAKEGY